MSVKKFRVYCLHDGSEKKMEIQFVDHNSKPFPLPCNGCEDLNGSSVCQRCTACITSMFFHNPQLDTSEPFLPR